MYSANGSTSIHHNQISGGLTVNPISVDTSSWIEFGNATTQVPLCTFDWQKLENMENTPEQHPRTYLISSGQSILTAAQQCCGVLLYLYFACIRLKQLSLKTVRAQVIYNQPCKSSEVGHHKLKTVVLQHSTNCKLKSSPTQIEPLEAYIPTFISMKRNQTGRPRSRGTALKRHLQLICEHTQTHRHKEHSCNSRLSCTWKR